MKRLPVVIIDSGVRGIAAAASRSRSHGSSRWKRTDTAMCVLDVKSHARKPTRSIVGAIARTSGVVRPVAPQSDWLPSRIVVSTISIVRPGVAHASASSSSQRVVTAPVAKSSCASTSRRSARFVRDALDLEAVERLARARRRRSRGPGRGR